MDKFKKNREIIFLTVFILGLISIGLFGWLEKNQKKENFSKEEIVGLISPEAEKIKNLPVVEEKSAVATEKIPDKILVQVPFTTQAPFANWDEYHEEACEEASLIMVKYFLDKQPLTPEIAEKEIQALIKFQIKNYGDYKDSSAKDLVRLAFDYHGIKNLKVVYDFSRDDLKKYLAQGKPIIIPAAGRMLGNPNFKAPGPLYHNLVLIGYNGNTIITNDPGTRKGKGYEYESDVLYQAIHDFPGKVENILQGRKAMIVIEN